MRFVFRFLFFSLSLTLNPLSLCFLLFSATEKTTTTISNKKQILKDDDTLAGVGFGDSSFLVLMTKVGSSVCLLSFFF